MEGPDDLRPAHGASGVAALVVAVGISAYFFFTVRDSGANVNLKVGIPKVKVEGE